MLRSRLRLRESPPAPLPSAGESDVVGERGPPTLALSAAAGLVDFEARPLAALTLGGGVGRPAWEGWTGKVVVVVKVEEEDEELVGRSTTLMPLTVPVRRGNPFEAWSGCDEESRT